jgi:hypothetical protein
MQCRSDEAKFHRAHFRLAQAFNWAPLFCNPDSSIDGVGNECIPSMNDICIPGHETGSCRENAALIIENLFDKRRYGRDSPVTTSISRHIIVCF